MGRTVSDASYYVGVRERMRKLLARGAKLAHQDSSTPGETIVRWLDDVEQCLEDGGVILLDQLSEFRKLRETCVFKVDEGLLNYQIVESETGTRLEIDSD